MEIVQAAESDSGFYKCVARFRSLTFESRQAFVKVAERKNTGYSFASSSSLTTKSNQIDATRPPPRFYLAPEDRNAQLDDEVIFDCLAINDASIQVVSSSVSPFGEPNATEFYRYKWLKDGIALDLKWAQIGTFYRLTSGLVYFNFKE